MEDYHVTIKIQQGRVRKFMNRAGIKSVAELAEKIGSSGSEIGLLLNFKKTPRTKNGQWRKCVWGMAKLFCVEPNEIFPEHLHFEFTSNQIAGFVEQQQLDALSIPQLTPYEECVKEEVSEKMEAVLATLAENEQAVIRMHFFEDKTFEDCGKELNVTRERARQILFKGLRKLRHPTRVQLLEGMIELPEEDDHAYQRRRKEPDFPWNRPEWDHKQSLASRDAGCLEREWDGEELSSLRSGNAEERRDPVGLVE